MKAQGNCCVHLKKKKKGNYIHFGNVSQHQLIHRAYYGSNAIVCSTKMGKILKVHLIFL